MKFPNDSNRKLFIVLARPRTGSTLLMSYLNSHPDVNANGEVLARLNGRCHRAALRSAFARNRKRGLFKARGFKLFFDHPFDTADDELFETLSKLPNLHVIHLKRRNLLRRFVSRKIAHQSGQWCMFNPNAGKSPQEKKLRVEVNEIMNEFQRANILEQKCNRYFIDYPMISVDYEYLAEYPNIVFRHVCDFLGVTEAVPATELLKQNPEPLRALVENYSELKQTFASTPWSYLFNE